MAEQVLVTGGLGYLGSILCEHLLGQGYRVKAVDNLMYGPGQQGLFHLCARPTFDFTNCAICIKDWANGVLGYWAPFAGMYC